MQNCYRAICLAISILCLSAECAYSGNVAISLNGIGYSNGQTVYLDCSVTQIRPNVYDPDNSNLTNRKIEWGHSSNFSLAENSFFRTIFNLDPSRADGYITVKLDNTQMTLYITQKMTPTITVSPNVCSPGQSGFFAATLNYYGPNSTNIVWETTGGVTVNGGSYYRITDNTIGGVTVQYNSMGTLSVYGEIPGCGNMRTREATKQLGPPDLSLFTVNSQTYNSPTNGNVCVGSNQAIQAVVSGNTQSYNWSVNGGGSYNSDFSAYGNSASFTPLGAGSFFVELTLGNSCGTTSWGLNFYAYDCFSSYVVYPNPASDYLEIEFADASEITALPDQIILFDDTSTKAIESVNVQDIYNRKGFTSGNKIRMNVKDLPRGVYYVHIKNSRKKEKKTDIIRVLLE